MKINNNLITEAIGLITDRQFECAQLGLVNHQVKNTLTFLDDVKFGDELKKNDNITVVITKKNLLSKLKNKICIISEDPRNDFYNFYNFYSKLIYKKTLTVIHKSSKIHSNAYISDHNVTIGKNCIIEPNVNIMPDVEIGDNTRICAGAVLGADGFELKRTSKGIVSVNHDGKLIIGKNVLIGCNAVLVKGFSFKDTIIGNSTKIDNLVYIAHSSNIGEECFIVGSAMVCGSATLGNRVWVGPKAIISNGIKIEDDSFISIGSVVTCDVKKGQTVTGNFAISHEKFMKNLKKIR